MHVNLIHISATPFNATSSKLRHAERSNDTRETVEGRGRNVENAWAVKLQLQLRRKDVSSCSGTVPFNKLLSVIFLQRSPPIPQVCNTSVIWCVIELRMTEAKLHQRHKIKYMKQWIHIMAILVFSWLSKCGAKIHKNSIENWTS